MAQALRILIVEDEYIVAMDLESLIHDMGHQVVATISRLSEAVQFVSVEAIDLAILDLNLRGEKSFPVAEVLRRRDIPFVFASGYGSAGLTPDFEQERTLQKPYQVWALKQAIDDAVGRSTAL